MKKIFLMIFPFIIISIIYGQSPTFKWVNQIGGTSRDGGSSIDIDALGNIYTIGHFSGKVDFDPNAGTYYLTSVKNNDIFISKTDSLGNLIWAKQLGGATYNDPECHLTLDKSGYIYITGDFEGTGDFDPSGSTYNLTTNGAFDAFIAKYDTSGNLTWAKNIGGPGYDFGKAISVDSYGNVYSTGTFEDSADFDPGSALYNLQSAKFYDFYVSKLNSSGDFVWAKRFGGKEFDLANSLVADIDGNTYLTGGFEDTFDFDPSNSTYNLIGTGDIFILKLNKNGNLVWVKQIGGAGNPNIGGTGTSIILDRSGNIYTAGGYFGNIDFDPGPGQSYINSMFPNYVSMYILKLDSLGKFSWVKGISPNPNYNGSSNIYNYCIALDSSNNIYTTGQFNGIIDFDPSLDTFNLRSILWSDIFVSKLNSSGDFAWSISIGDSSFYESANSIKLDNKGNVYLTGYFSDTLDFDTDTTEHLIISNGKTDAYLLKVSQFNYSNCVPPPRPTINRAIINPSKSVTLKWGHISQARVYYIYFSKGSCSNYQFYDSTILDSINIYGLMASTQYSFVVKSVNNCASNFSNCKTITTNQIPSILIVSSEIPPWQRKNDPYEGSLTISTKNPSSAKWHLKIAAYYNNLLIKTINYPSTNNATQKFYSNDLQLDIEDSLVGIEFRYFAILDTTLESVEVIANLNNPKGNNTTKIIESRWDYANYYYHNNGSKTIKIPIKFDLNNPATSVTFEREGHVALQLKLLPPRTPETIISKSGGGNFFLNPNSRYLTLSPTNSNIVDVFPGDFKMIVWSGNIPIETNYFDLTKFGKILPNGNNSTKLIVMVGGIFNEIEESIIKLRNDTSVYLNNSKSSYSICTYLENSGFNGWYIAQGNANSIARNAYDIGRSLDSINIIQPTTEMNLICHSKGGLDARGFLEEYTQSYDKKHYFGIGKSKVKSKIKKIVFLATPHKGAIIAQLLSLPSKLVDCPAALDLRVFSPNLYEINRLPLKINPKILNLSGYLNFYSLNDGIVELSSSEVPYNGCVQLYQNDPNFILKPYLFDILHMRLHASKTISEQGKCTDQFKNLEKIEQFLLDQNIVSCKRNTKNIFLFTTASVLSNAKIEYKHNIDSTYSLIGFSDENGYFKMNLYLDNYLGDSIRISASGIETQILGIDSSIALKGIIKLPMFHLQDTNYLVQSPTIEFIEQNPITNNSKITLLIKAKNAVKFETNSPSNQDSTFTHLNISNNTGTINLDTGYNKIIIRFIGIKDTVNLVKEVYYFPDSLMNLYSDTTLINSELKNINTKIYVDNNFYEVIKNTKTNLRILRGHHELKFSQYGYLDTIISIDTAGSINLQMQDISYISNSDSIIYNYDKDQNLNYWKNITTKKIDLVKNTSIKIKQLANSIENQALIPLSRSFLFENLSQSGSPILKAGICLDQKLQIKKDSAYLLFQFEKNQFEKHFFYDTGTINYDSIVQKLSLDNINFNNGKSKSVKITIMQKQAPSCVDKKYNLNAGDSIILKLSSLFEDPDSIRNDMIFTSFNLNPNLKIQINNEIINIKTTPNAVGENSFILSCSHDGITKSIEIKIIIDSPSKINAPQDFITKFNIHPNPFNSKITVDCNTNITGNFNMRIYNLLGNEITTLSRQLTIENNIFEFDLSYIPDGIYYFQCFFGNNVKTGKILKLSTH